RQRHRHLGVWPLDRVEPPRPAAGDRHLAAVLVGAHDDLADAVGTRGIGVDEQSTAVSGLPVAPTQLDDAAVALALAPLHAQRRAPGGGGEGRHRSLPVRPELEARGRDVALAVTERLLDVVGTSRAGEREEEEAQGGGRGAHRWSPLYEIARGRRET